MKFNAIIYIALLISNFLTVSTSMAATNQKAEKLYNEGLAKNKAGLLIEASVFFTEAIALDDQQHRYYHQRGLSFFGMEKTQHGIKDFKKSVDLKSDNLNVYLTLIKHYMSHSQHMLVLIITDQMIINLPDQKAGAYYDKGRAYEAMNNRKMAIKAYQAATKALTTDQNEFKQLLSEKILTLQSQENSQ